MRAGLLVSLALLGCTSGAAAPPDVIVIVLDTLRIDRTTVFDRRRDTTPFLADLASRSVLFQNAWSTSSWTAPAVASIFTGTYPSQHGVDVGIWLFERLRDERPELRLKQIPAALETLPEVLRAHGYATFGIADNPNISRAEGFSRGFERFASADYRGGAELNALLADWAPAIRSARPAFVYLHYMDPHWPYHEHAEHYRPPESDSERVREIARYDAELRYLDARLREAFALLAPSDDALVVVVSDHGEELYERGTGMAHRQHGFQLYDELGRVLLLIRDLERAPGGARIRAPASLVDVLPTLRDRVGAGVGAQAAGRSWLAHYADGAPADDARALFAMRREVVAPDRRLRAVVGDGWKYIRTESAEGERIREQLYDLRRDGGERVDLARSEPERRAAMHQRWLAFERAAPRWQPAAATRALSAGEAERLRALGYAEGPAGAEPEAP